MDEQCLPALRKGVRDPGDAVTIVKRFCRDAQACKAILGPPGGEGCEASPRAHDEILDTGTPERVKPRGLTRLEPVDPKRRLERDDGEVDRVGVEICRHRSAE